MPVSNWIKVPDAMIAAYSPVTGRLITRLRNNVSAVPDHAFRNPYTDVGGLTASGTYATVGQLWLVVPDCFIGAGGVRLRLRLFGLASGTPPPTPSGDGRFQVVWTGGGGGSVNSDSFGFTTLEAATLDAIFTPPADEKVTVNIQGKLTFGTDVEVTWEAGAADSFAQLSRMD